MSIRKRFNQNFGVKDTLEEEQSRFVQRTNQLIFNMIDTQEYDNLDYPATFDNMCFQLGENANDLWRRFKRTNDDLLSVGPDELAPDIRTLTSDDFQKTLMVLCILYQVLKDYQKIQKWLSDCIQKILSKATCDLGVRWKDGLFYRSGAEELDTSLIEETLTWLNDYPDEKKDYEVALSHYSKNGSVSDVIKNCYTALEGIARNILGNQKTLDNNVDELLSKIGLSNGWKAILSHYIKYAHDFRHASKQRHQTAKQEAEAYLYMTGLLIRLLIESK